MRQLGSKIMSYEGVHRYTRVHAVCSCVNKGSRTHTPMSAAAGIGHNDASAITEISGQCLLRDSIISPQMKTSYETLMYHCSVQMTVSVLNKLRQRYSN